LNTIVFVVNFFIFVRFVTCCGVGRPTLVGSGLSAAVTMSSLVSQFSNGFCALLCMIVVRLDYILVVSRHWLSRLSCFMWYGFGETHATSGSEGELGLWLFTFLGYVFPFIILCPSTYECCSVGSYPGGFLVTGCLDFHVSCDMGLRDPFWDNSCHLWFWRGTGSLAFYFSRLCFCLSSSLTIRFELSSVSVFPLWVSVSGCCLDLLFIRHHRSRQSTTVVIPKEPYPGLKYVILSVSWHVPQHVPILYARSSISAALSLISNS